MRSRPPEGGARSGGSSKGLGLREIGRTRRPMTVRSI